MSETPIIRDVAPSDFDQWLPLWHGYNAFYERVGATALPHDVTQTTWSRFFDPNEPIYAGVAEIDRKLVGLVHYLFHRSTTMIPRICYLQDLFASEGVRGRGVGRALIAFVYAQARAAGSTRVYWQTHETNTVARSLYDKVSTRSGFIVYRTEV